MHSRYHFKFMIGDRTDTKFRFWSDNAEGQLHTCTALPDRERLNPTALVDWEAEYVGRLNTIYRFWHPTLAFTREFVDAFNTWQMGEHLEEVAIIQGDPGKYGEWSEVEHLCPPPPRLKGVVWQDGRYVEI